MKTIQSKFKTVALILFVSFAFVACSSDDDDSEMNDNDEDLKGGQASAVIDLDNQPVQFSSNGNQSFASLVKSQIGENEIDELVIIMMDDNSDLMIVAQAAPAPDNPINYDLSTPLTDDYFFSVGVAVDGKNSSDNKIYGVGTYQNGDDVVIQSQGSFKISALSNTSIKGTFEMTLYNTYDPNNVQDAEKLTVTEGEFDLPIVELDEEDLANLGLD